jgi:hypothetical protein
MGYFKEFINYATPYFTAKGFKLKKGKVFELISTDLSKVFGFISYQSGYSFGFYIGVYSKNFNKIFEEIVGWGFALDLTLFIESGNSLSRVLDKVFFSIESEKDFPGVLKEVERVYEDFAIPFYEKNNSLLAIQHTLRNNEIFRPMIGNTDFYLVDWYVGILIDLVITKLYQPGEFGEVVERYREQCYKKQRRGYGPNPDEVIDYANVIDKVKNEYLPLFEQKDWDKYRKQLGIPASR